MTQETQLDLGLRTSARPLRLSRDLRNVPLDRYRLPKDGRNGRNWKKVARERMALAEWLATHGDADGSRIYPSEKSMSRHFGWSRRKTFYLLADLGEDNLDLLVSAGRLTSKHGTRVRKMNLSVFLGSVAQDLRTAEEVQGVQEVQASIVEVQSKVAHDRHQTGLSKKREESNHRFSSNSPKPTPMNVLSPQTIEEKKQTAKTVLVKEKGCDSDVVEIALLRVANLAATKNKNPRTVAYFIASVERSLADDEEAAACQSIAAERRRVGVAIDAPLSPEEWHSASKIAFLHAAVEDADRLGRRATDVVAERLAAANQEREEHAETKKICAKLARAAAGGRGG